MKVVILAGGLGTRISEETDLRPKPMVEIGGRPIIWHIMKIYSHFGYNEFVICLGYKGYVVKEYFTNYLLHNSDVTIDIKKNETTIHQSNTEDWKITLVDTGANSMTGGRIKRIQKHIGNEPFLLTYGDGVANVDIKKLVDFHLSNKKKVSVTTVQPGGKFGVLSINENQIVESFSEKPKGDGSSWINGGFFVCQPDIFSYIDGDHSIWERESLEKLAQEKEIAAFKHEGFWQPMDTLKDKNDLNELWENNKAPWKIWNT